VLEFAEHVRVAPLADTIVEQSTAFDWYDRRGIERLWTWQHLQKYSHFKIEIKSHQLKRFA
jgi:hypothetical protein